MDDSVVFRPMTAGEVQQLVDWAADEGWNPGIHDARQFHQIDPDGFFAAEVEGELAGGGAIVRHHELYGFMGLFIVRPEHRGSGLGRQLWYARRDRLIQRLKPKGTIGMDAVNAMREFYNRGGFREASLHVRFQLNHSTSVGPPKSRHMCARTVPPQQLAEFDRSCFPSPRDAYLRVWLTEPTSHTCASMEDGILRGYSISRRCRIGWKIGPLFAESREIAEGLFQSCCQAAGGEPVFLDVPEANIESVAMAQSFGMNPIFSCMRMYYGPTPTLQLDRVFGVTTLELG